MSLDATIALVDVSELKRYLNMDADIKIREEYLEDLINAASQLITDLCNRDSFILVSTAINEIWNGDGTKSYNTKNAPITEVVTTIYYWDGSNWQTLLGTSFTEHKAKGQVYFTDGNVFWTGKDNWKISYKYGYARGAVPADLKLACVKLIALNKKLFDDSLHGMTGKSFDWGSISFNLDDIPKAVQTIISKYRRY